MTSLVPRPPQAFIACSIRSIKAWGGLGTRLGNDIGTIKFGLLNFMHDWIAPFKKHYMYMYYSDIKFVFS